MAEDPNAESTQAAGEKRKMPLALLVAGGILSAIVVIVLCFCGYFALHPEKVVNCLNNLSSPAN
jgi:hypothetical protein